MYFCFPGPSVQRSSGKLSVAAERSHHHFGQSQDRDPASDRHPDREDAWRCRGSAGRGKLLQTSLKKTKKTFPELQSIKMK